jgi:uncharacterized membrane protein YgdD (TMEM256/DUF423 family)
LNDASARPAWTYRAGAAHALIGQTLLFLSIHPLRELLDAHALAMVQTMSAVQIGNGLALMLLARSDGGRLAPLLIALGTLASAAMIWIIAFTGTHPFDLIVPIGGLAMIVGWVMVLLRGGRP